MRDLQGITLDEIKTNNYVLVAPCKGVTERGAIEKII